MIIGILGFARTGKDTVADLILSAGAQKIGFADALKRTCINIFDFSHEQMWGSTEEKEGPDKRYPREHTWDRRSTHDDRKCLCCGIVMETWLSENVQCFLTPRYAMKIIGTEGARHCWNEIWVKKALDDAAMIQNGYLYNKALGIENTLCDYPKSAIFIDTRFINEVNAIQAAGGRVFRIKRPGYDKPAFDHPSETEQLRIPDDKLQGVIMNDGTLEDLRRQVLALLEE